MSGWPNSKVELWRIAAEFTDVTPGRVRSVVEHLGFTPAHWTWEGLTPDAADLVRRELRSRGATLVSKTRSRTATMTIHIDDAHEPVGPETTRRHTWTEFREAGMLWAANRAMHIFGWAIGVEYDDSGDVVDAYPVRTAWRGFDRDAEERGYRRVSRWMERAAAALREESER